MAKPVPKITKVVAIVVAIAGIALLFAAGSDDEARTEAKNKDPMMEFAGEDPPAGDDVIALLDGLKVGDEVGPSRVLAIDAPKDREVAVDVEAGGIVFSVGITRPGAINRGPAPITTDKYELGFGNARGVGELPTGAMQNTAEVIAARIRKRENEVPIPKGL